MVHAPRRSTLGRLARCTTGVVLSVLMAVALRGAVSAQSDGFDPDVLAMTYHLVTGEPMDTRSCASSSRVAMSASSVDRPGVVAAEQARLDAQRSSLP